MAKYRIRPGCTHGAHDQYHPGDVVEYAPEEAAGFMDKLELVEEAVVEPVDPVDTPAVIPPRRKTKRDGGL